jgi:hypothetical protein
MSILKSLTKQVRVKEYLEQELIDGSGSFPVVVFEGAVVGLDTQGAVRMTYKDNVRFSAFGFPMETLKQTFGEPGTIHKGLWIEQYRRTEPREWVTPDGEIIMITHDYRITDGSFAEDQPKAHPEAESRTPVDHLSGEVFSGNVRKNDLQPQI